MAYIGRDTDKISNIEKLDTITFDGSSSYTLQKNGVNFSPNSSNSLQVSIDGVVQAGNFTVSGSTIDFGVAIPSTSTCDFIFHYGTGLVTTVADGAITTAKLGDASVTSAKLDAGKVLQVLSTTKTDSFNTTSTSFTDITDLSVAITPSSTSNKILVSVNIGTHDSTSATTYAYQLVRDSTAIGLGSTSTAATMGGTINADRAEGQSMTFLDTPNTTSATTYKLQVRSPSGNTFYINEREGNSDYRTISTITVMEISG